MFPDEATRAKLHGYDERALNNQDYRSRMQAVLGV
jgi:hypothetical protein